MDSIDLHVNPIDPEAPGSYKQFKAWAAVSEAIDEANKIGNQLAIGKAMLAAAKFTEPYIVDGAGQPVNVEELDLSLKQMMDLVRGVGGEAPIPLESKPSLRAGRGAKAPRRNGRGS